jgi:carbamate kinase
VASPLPKRILDLEVIKALVAENAIVICCGGGGIPVIHNTDHYVGVPAVIDKDRLSTLLAIEIEAEALIISTAIDAIRTGFGTSDEVIHSTLSVADAKKYIAEGEFPSGSMGPKVESLIDAVEHVEGIKSLLCQPGDAIKALRGDSGTIITK